MEISINIETNLEDAEDEVFSYLSNNARLKICLHRFSSLMHSDIHNDEDKLDVLKKLKEDLVFLNKKVSSTINTIEEVRRTKKQIKTAGENVLLNNYHQDSNKEGEENG